MGSHVPGFAEHLFSSNAGYLASHTDISVFIVR
jgi:nucleotide-binding universal stress UspA family protein